MPQQTKKSSTKRSSSSSPRRAGSTRSSNGSSRVARAKSRRTNGSGPGATGRPSSRRSSGSRASNQRSSPSSKRARSKKSPVASAADVATERVKNAGGAVGDVAKKARGPAIAAGVGLAGLATGVGLASRNSRKRVLGVPMPTKSGAQAVSENLAEAAKNVGSFGEGMGSLAVEVRKVREGFAGGDAEKRRSPIEVVLQGLTKRR
jgi:hypothetical protein